MSYKPTYILEQYDRETTEKKFCTGLTSRNALEWAKKLGTCKDGDTIIIRKNDGEPLSGAIWEKEGGFYRRARKEEIKYLWEKWKFLQEQQQIEGVQRIETEEAKKKLWETGFFA